MVVGDAMRWGELRTGHTEALGLIRTCCGPVSRGRIKCQ